MRLPTLNAVMLLFVLCLSVAPAQGAKIYKWVDPDGTVHYGNSAPGGQAAKEVRPQRSHISDAQAQERLKSLTEGSQEQDKNRELVKKGDDEDSATALQRKQNCEAARKNLKLLEKAGSRVQAKDDKGESFYLTPETREKKVAESKSQIKEFCG